MEGLVRFVSDTHRSPRNRPATTRGSERRTAVLLILRGARAAPRQRASRHDAAARGGPRTVCPFRSPRRAAPRSVA
eukprot:scaffold897_cov402-Prasinococcus_capsulatus_cf.AAC.59